MKVRDFDLYINGYIESFADGFKYLERDEIVYEGNDTDRIHTVKAGETLTRIAYKRYKDTLKNPSLYWWIIADANDITNPMNIVDLIGHDIVIPDPVLFQLNL